ncbi:MAG: type III-B CRISPR module-associated protein Cmr5 [Bradymonadaceae bacterium]
MNTTDNNPSGTLDQRRAVHALAAVKKAESHNKAKPDRYLSYVQALPATIVMNGLGQAIATVLANAAKEPAYGLLHEHLQSWLCGDDIAAPYRGAQVLITAVAEGDQSSYVRAQAEALAYLVWLKKFSQAFLKEEARDA